jgi:23S rRNA pseudouridine2605 synthase
MNSNHKSSGGRQARKGSSPQRKNSFRKDFKKPLSTPKKVDIGGIRLNKFISNSGICSRREADTYIEHGSVTVNGNLVTEMGYKVQPNDDVRFDGTSISPEKKKYVLLGISKLFGTSFTPINTSQSVKSLTTCIPSAIYISS